MLRRHRNSITIVILAMLVVRFLQVLDESLMASASLWIVLVYPLRPVIGSITEALTVPNTPRMRFCISTLKSFYCKKYIVY